MGAHRAKNEIYAFWIGSSRERFARKNNVMALHLLKSRPLPASKGIRRCLLRTKHKYKLTEYIPNGNHFKQKPINIYELNILPMLLVVRGDVAREKCANRIGAMAAMAAVADFASIWIFYNFTRWFCAHWLSVLRANCVRYVNVLPRRLTDNRRCRFK